MKEKRKLELQAELKALIEELNEIRKADRIIRIRVSEISRRKGEISREIGDPTGI